MQINNRPVTIKDIARKFRCSPSTVSRALNNDMAVNELTRANIQAFAKAIGYQRNTISLSLLKRKTNSIGVILPYVVGYFFSALIDGLESILEPKGYTLTLCQSRESYRNELKAVEVMLANQVDGMFVAASMQTRDYAHFDRVLVRGMPLIFIDRDCVDYDAHKVLVDDYRGAYEAVEHLIAMGCRRIAHIKGPDNLSVSSQRLRAYKSALEAHGMAIEPELIVTASFRTPGGLLSARKLLSLPNPPDAIFAANDNIAISALYVIREMGLRVPQDIAVIGFDNDPHSAFLSPSLTTVAQPVFDLGREAAKLYLGQIKTGNDLAETIVLPSRLIVRESSRRLPPA